MLKLNSSMKTYKPFRTNTQNRCPFHNRGLDCKSRKSRNTWGNRQIIAKFRLKLKKVGKTTRPFRYDLNQIPYDYTVEVRNRFKGLNLIDRVPDELWMEVPDIVQETGIKTIPMEKKFKKQNGYLGRPYK